MEKEKISGVYKITNNITGDCYIGSSCNIRKRWRSHRSPAAWANLPNSKLYQDMAQYGLNNFTFEIIEITDNRVEREQYWISQLSPKYNSYRALRTEEERLSEMKEYYESHKPEYLARKKEYYKAHREEILPQKNAYQKEYCNRKCLYNGEILTLNTLSARFRRQGIPHPTLEAKNYLL